MTLPPPFTLVRLRELGDAFAHAKSIAPKQGAGTLVYVGRFDLAEFAVVLEPDEPLRLARRAFYAGMAALADALAAQAQPETEIAIDWPDSISVNGGLVGGGRLAWPQGGADDATPPWLVFGAMIRTVSMSGSEPGLNPLVTALDGGRLHRRHVRPGGRELRAPLHGRHRRLAGARFRRGRAQTIWNACRRKKACAAISTRTATCCIRRMGKVEVERQALLPRLAKPAWFDPAAKGPRT